MKAHCAKARECPPRLADVSRPRPDQAQAFVHRADASPQSFSLASSATLVDMVVADLKRELNQFRLQLSEDLNKQLNEQLNEQFSNQWSERLSQQVAHHVKEQLSGRQNTSRTISQNSHDGTTNHQACPSAAPSSSLSLMSIGQEVTSDLFSEAEMHDLFLKKNDGLMIVLKRTFFNPERPQFHHTRLVNIKHNMAEIVQNGEWTSVRAPKAVDSLVTRAQDILFERYRSDAQYRNMISENHVDVFDWQISLLARQRRTYSAIAGDVKSLLMDRYKQFKQYKQYKNHRRTSSANVQQSA